MLSLSNPAFMVWVTISLLGTFVSARTLLSAERPGERIAAWISAGASLLFSVSAVLDLAALISGAA